MRLLLLVFAMFALLVPALLAQDTGWGMHKRMFAVPAPEKVTIDGKLDDWDLSGALTVYVMAATKDAQSGKVAVMYDADALYLGAEVRDPTPLMNRHSPEAEGDYAWDADAFQFRLALDPQLGYPLTATTWDKTENDQIVHLTLWYYTDRREPNLQAVSGMIGALLPKAEKFGVMPKRSYQSVYRLAEDKQGYIFEYRIPWALLGAKTQPKAGDIVAATMQFDWGRADGLKTSGISGWGYDLMCFAGFPYQNAGCWGKLIFSKTGKLPKELVEEGMPPEKPLPLTFEYDLPEDSEVTITLVNAKNEVVRTLTAQAPRLGGHVTERWDGLDDLDRPLPAGEYTWKGLYHKPITTQYVLSVHNSGQPAWKNDNNTGGWGGDHGAPIAICTAGDDLIMAWDYAEAGWGLIRTDGEGTKKWGTQFMGTYLTSDGARIYEAVGAQVCCYDARDGRPLPYGNGAASLAPPPDGKETTNTVTGLAYRDGKVYISFAARNLIGIYDARQGALQTTWEVPAPGYLALKPNGELVALSAGKLVTINDGKVTPLVGEGLDDPWGVTVDATGTLYVSNRGKRQNISVFSADGQYLRSIGKAGGRPASGRFDPAGMLEPAGLAVDTKGRLWVMEAIDSPKRVSVWNTQTGQLVKEFFGGAHYSSFIWMDPERPDEVYCDGALWKVDLNKKTSYPFSTVWRSSDPNSPGSLATHSNGLRLFTAKNGRQYGWANESHYGTVLMMRDGDRFKPILMFFWTASYNTGTYFPLTADQKKYPDGNYIWVDQNDDQMLQDVEISPADKTFNRGFSCVDRDLNIWDASGHLIRPLRIEADGRPVYDFTKFEQTGIIGAMVADPDDGSVYTLSEEQGINFGRYQPNGTPRWGYQGSVTWPKALGLPPQRLGKLWGPTALLGTAGDFTGFATYFGCHHIYTRDGIAVAMIFRDPRASTKLGPDIIACENYNGQLVKPKGMNRYFALGGDQDGRITEVLGLDTVKRLQGGKYAVSAGDVQKVAAAQMEYQTRLAKGQKLTIVRGRKALDAAPPVGKTTGAAQSFQARAAYDEVNLYVKFEVNSPADLVNGITDPQIIFKGGNCLDIQLAADPNADPVRTTPAPGDVRVLITQRNGKPMAVIYRPKIKGFQGQPIIFRTGNVESFDAIELNEQIKLEYSKSRTQAAFTALVTIPLTQLGWTPLPGTKVKFDVGYIYGNIEGTKVMMRSYWSNNGFSANVLNDVPNESKLVPNEWGMAEVE